MVVIGNDTFLKSPHLGLRSHQLLISYFSGVMLLLFSNTIDVMCHLITPPHLSQWNFCHPGPLWLPKSWSSEADKCCSHSESAFEMGAPGRVTLRLWSYLVSSDTVFKTRGYENLNACLLVKVLSESMSLSPSYLSFFFLNKSWLSYRDISWVSRTLNEAIESSIPSPLLGDQVR